MKKIKQQFFNSLKCGTGEAYLIAQNHPTVDFSKYILKGALKNYAYDAQAEGSRAEYIFELIELSTQKKTIRKAILKGIKTEKRDSWALVQLFEPPFLCISVFFTLYNKTCRLSIN